jgi:hypothetical protein
VKEGRQESERHEAVREEQRQEALRRQEAPREELPREEPKREEPKREEPKYEEPKREEPRAAEPAPAPAPMAAPVPQRREPKIDSRALLESSGLVMVETDRSKAAEVAPPAEQPQRLGRPRRERPKPLPQDEELQQVETRK